jgi:hypothetical protein
MNKRIQSENTEILQYRKATQQLFAGIIPKSMFYELEQISMGLNVSLDAKNEDRTYCLYHRKKARSKLAQLSNLRPPVSVIQIHDIYLKALILVVDAWKAAENKNLFKASTTFNVSSNMLMKAEDFWAGVDLQ